MEQSAINFGDPVVARGITIIPVVRTVRSSARAGGGVFCFANKEPAAVIILGSEGCRIFDEKWEEISREAFTRAFPDLTAPCTPDS